MNLARLVKDFIKCGRTILVPFKGLLFLAGPRIAKSGINSRIIGVTATIFLPVLIILVAPRLSFSVTHLRRAGLVAVIAASQPAILARAKSGHQGGESHHGPWLITDAMPESSDRLCVRTVDYLVLFS